MLLAVVIGLALPGLSPVSAQTSQPTSAQTTRPTTAPAKDAKPPPKDRPATTQPAMPPGERALPHIAYLFPAGGQRGTAVEITAGGQGFVDVDSVRVSGEGVEAALARTVDDKKLTLSVTIAEDAALGERDLRVVTSGGVSNRVRFIVGQLPEAVEVEPNSQRGQAQRLSSLPVVVNGQALAGDIDFYRFPAKANQVLVLRVQARALIPFMADAVPGWMQATLALYDADGRRLAYADDFRFDPDPVLIFTVPKNGEYIVAVQDSLFRGRDDFVYRLEIGELPFIADVYPLGARCGTTTQVELHGANLPDPVVSVDLSGDCPPRRPISVTAQGLVSNALPLATGVLEEIAESEPNDVFAQADHVKVPVTVNGRIDRPGDVDFFVFRAQAGEELIIDLRARRLGSPLDSIVTLLNAKGSVLAKNDDTIDPAEPMLTHHADSRIVWKCPAAGDYTVRVADTQGKGGEEYAYRLTIAPPQPDFALRILPDNPRLAPGGTVVLTAEAIRKDGFDGEVRLSAAGLDGDWFLRAATIPSGQTLVRFTLTAPADTAPGLVSPTFLGTADSVGGVRAAVPAEGVRAADSVGGPQAAELAGPADHVGGELVREAWPAEEVMQAFGYQHRLAVRELLLAVVEGGLFTLSAEVQPDEVVEVPQTGEATLVIKAVRGQGVDGPIRLAADGPPRGVSVKSVVIPAGQNEVTLPLSAAPTSTLGTAQNLILVGTTKVGKATISRYVPAIPIRIVPGATTAPAE